MILTRKYAIDMNRFVLFVNSTFYLSILRVYHAVR